MQDCKTSDTNLERYGDRNYNNKSTVAQTRLLLDGTAGSNNMERSKITCLKKNGVDHSCKVPSIGGKRQPTITQSYGLDHLGDLIRKGRDI